ncbi:hypothetical protein [Micromonospora sp. NPDC048843]|uniref:hypothetical protein n=1 Tax=Micromonospora sp. NPDC048843 TaxID=3155389 RepID=UPI0033F4CA47
MRSTDSPTPHINADRPDVQSSARHSVVEVDEDGFNLAAEPDFAKLFPLYTCSGDDCDACAGFQPTLRTAAALRTIAPVLADQAFDDIRLRELSR